MKIRASEMLMITGCVLVICGLLTMLAHPPILDLLLVGIGLLTGLIGAFWSIART